MKTLRPYQREAVDLILKERRKYLTLPPGCGKSAISLTACREAGCRRVLVVAPVSVGLLTWRDQVAEWWPDMPVVMLVGSPAARDKALATGSEAIYVAGYEVVRKDIAKYQAVKWDAIVLDETIKIQSPISKVTKALLMLDAPIKIALNGTPISNGYQDIWATYTWLDKYCLLGNWYAYRRVFAVMNPYFPAIVGWRNIDEIKRRTNPLTFYRDKKEILSELPPLTEQVIPVELSSAEKKIYDQIKQELSVTIKGEDVSISNALVELMRLRQATNGLFNFEESGGSSKLDAVEELLQRIPPDKKVIIFSQFSQTIHELHRRLGSESSKIIGETSTGEREDAADRFQNGGLRILLGTSAMSYGLNLQAASYIIHVDLPWSYAKYDQQIGRAHRMGQADNVVVYNMEAVGTVDSKVRKILERKVMIADDFAGVTRADIDEILA